MSAMTNFFFFAVLNTARGVSASAPGTVYLALFLSSPGESGTAGTEVSYAGYSRQPVTFAAPVATGTSVSMSNSSQVTFPTPEVSAGTATYAALCDAVSGGNVLVYKSLTDPIALTPETSPRFAAGDLVLTFAGGYMSSTFKRNALNYLRGTSIQGFSPYLALYNASPEDTGVELSGTGYSRIPLTFGNPSEQTSGQMQITNTNTAESSPAASNWGTWAYSAIMTAETGGDVFYFYPNETSYAMNNGAQVYVDAGNISLSIN